MSDFKNLPDPERDAVMRQAAGASVSSYVVEDELPALSNRARWAVTVVLVVLALVSFFPAREYFSSPEAHQETIATIDEKIGNVFTLTAGSAGASTLISLAPGDAGSAIADKLMDLSVGFLVVLAALYLEKYLITIFGAAALGLLFPLAALAAIGFVWTYDTSHRWASIIKRIGFKLLLLGVVLLIAIPTSTWVTNQIDATYESSMQETLDSAEALAEGAAEAEEEDREGLDAVIGFFEDAVDAVGSVVTSVAEGAQKSFNQFVEALAVMLVTSCLIPLLVLLFYFWVAKILLGLNIDVPVAALNPRRLRQRATRAISSKREVQ